MATVSEKKRKEGRQVMNLEKAIKLLQLDLDDPGCVPIEDLNKAQELGIEALRAIQKARKGVLIDNVGRLPGED